MTGLLSGDEIMKAGIIEGAEADQYRGSSYDVRIGKIINPMGEVVDSYTIPTQGIVQVVSAERVKLPTDISGYALVKTGLSNEGLLALDIGIIDPGYGGMISSAVINFGKNDRLLSAGETFLRLTFHRIDGRVVVKNPVAIDDKKYMKDKRNRVIQYLSPYFLNVDAIARKSAEDVVGKWKLVLMFWIPVIAVLLAFVTFALNYGALWSIQRVFQPTVNTGLEGLRSQLEQQTEDLKSQNKALSDRLDNFEQLLNQIKDSQSGQVPIKARALANPPAQAPNNSLAPEQQNVK